jgi:biopolymer transport protein ExbD
MPDRPRLTHRRLPARRFGAGDPEVFIDINTTPLIDVLLVLLVMLIITIPIQWHAVTLALPVAAAEATEPPRVQIDIDANDVVRWQGLQVDVDELDRRMGEAAQQMPLPIIRLRPHRDSRYAVFAHVLAATRRHGLDRVAVIGSEQFAR